MPDGKTDVEKRLLQILVADDEAANHRLLETILAAEGYAVLHAENGAEALALCREKEPDMVLTDLMMPEMDGRQLLDALKSDPALRHIPVIVVSAVDDLRTVADCIELGAEDHLVKPFVPTLLRARIRSGLARKKLFDYEKGYRARVQRYNEELEARVREQVQRLSEAQWAIIYALSNLAESRDPETGEHIERMCIYCRILAEHLAGGVEYKAIVDDEFVHNLYAAAPLHDIGKVGVPDEILLKPGKLTPEEFEVMKDHTVIGAQTLEKVNQHCPGNTFITMGIDIARYHHEKWDGSGYPEGLSGEAIPLSARILALGDVYDALTSDRCYKKAFSHEKSRDIILEGRGTHFAPDVADAFIVCEDTFRQIRRDIRDGAA